jgi:hypothetical protein
MLLQERKNKLEDINFSKFGWVDQVAKKWQVSCTQVRRIMKRYFPKIFSTAFQRKSK